MKKNDDDSLKRLDAVQVWKGNENLEKQAKEVTIWETILYTPFIEILPGSPSKNKVSFFLACIIRSCDQWADKLFNAWWACLY